jgi:integrase
MLKATPRFLISFVTIGAFAGLRHEEIQRLAWEDIDLEGGYIHVGAEKSKTAQRRLVPIQPNLKLWLNPHVKERGKVNPRRYMTRHLHKIAAAAKIKWPKNALRHSFGTFRLAETQNAHQVSDEMGNSPTIVREHYRELVTKKQASKWWNIVPPPSLNGDNPAIDS